MKKLSLIFILSLIIVGFPLLTFAMSSPNYSIPSESINIGGERQVSGNYSMEDTIGEFISGSVNTPSYLLRAGYQWWFSVLGGRSLTLTSPNGGEVWEIGETREITWTSIGGITNVKIEYSKDDFDSDIHEIAASTPNDGSYFWTIPSDLSETVKVRISDVTDADVNDRSDGYFQLASAALGGTVLPYPSEEEAPEEVPEEEEIEEVPPEKEQVEEVPKEEVPEGGIPGVPLVPEEKVPEKIPSEERIPEEKPPKEEALGPVSKIIKWLRENKTVAEINKKVTIPGITTAVTVNTVGLALTSFPLLVPNFPFLLAQLLALLAGLFKKKRRTWGVVFSSFNLKPLRGVIVRIYEKQTDKLRETQITDKEGRFGFLVDPGQYYIKTQKPGYIFPTSEKELTFHHQQITAYRGETVTVKEKEKGLVNVMIPLDPNRSLIPSQRLFSFKLFNKLQSSLEKASLYVFIPGFSFSGFTYLVTPNIYNKIILALYLFLLATYIVSSFNFKKQYGVMRDSKTKLPLSSVVIRFFNSEYGQLTQERLTDKRGRYRFLVSPGTYYLMALKEGYQVFQSELLTIKPGGAIEKDFELERAV